MLRYTRRQPHLCKPGRIMCVSSDAQSDLQWPTTKTALRKLSKVASIMVPIIESYTSQAELESHLQRRQLPVDGLKGDLIDRLYNHLQAAEDVPAEQPAAEAPIVAAVVEEQPVVEAEDDAPTSVNDLLAWKKARLAHSV